MSPKPPRDRPTFFQHVLILLIIAIIVTVILALLAPVTGNVSPGFVNSL